LIPPRQRFERFDSEAVLIWWLWKYSEGAEKVIKGKYSAPVIFMLLFLTSIIGQAILQTELNKLAALPAGDKSKEVESVV
jgi:hypothetical protein